MHAFFSFLKNLFLDFAFNFNFSFLRPVNGETKKGEWWNRKKNGTETPTDSEGTSDDGDVKPKDDVEPVAFYKMFKYATGTNKFMYFVGVIAAIATGLTTPANSLIFGNLANVSFK